jgi:competence protein ComEC
MYIAKRHSLNWKNLIYIIILFIIILKSYLNISKNIISYDSYSDIYYPLFCEKFDFITYNYSNINQCSDYANFASGILFGKAKFTEEFSQSFKSLSLIHLVVASGSQISLIIDFVEKSLTKVGILKKLRFFILTISVFLFAYSLGFTPPIVRASIFSIILIFLSTFFGENVSGYKALLITLIIIFIIFPSWLYSISLWLSVLASLSITIANKYFRKSLFNPIIAQILILILLFPLLSQFNTSINLISIPMNIVLGLIIPYLILILFFCLIPLFNIVAEILSVIFIPFIVNVIVYIDEITKNLFILKLYKFQRLDFIIFYSTSAIILIIFDYYYTYNQNLKSKFDSQQLK